MSVPPGLHISFCAAPHDRHAAFSLVELLITVAVISILCALAVPALRGGLGRADDARCVSNMRALVSAAILYGSENNGGSLPVISNNPANGADHNHWMFNEGYHVLLDQKPTKTASELSATFRCPTAVRLKNPGFIHYGMNVTGLDINANYNTPGWSPNTRAISSPARRIYFIDGLDWMINSNRAGSYTAGQTEATTTYTPAFRHKGAAHAAFYDGHIESLKQADAVKQKELWDLSVN